MESPLSEVNAVFAKLAKLGKNSPIKVDDVVELMGIVKTYGKVDISFEGRSLEGDLFIVKIEGGFEATFVFHDYLWLVRALIARIYVRFSEYAPSLISGGLFEYSGQIESKGGMGPFMLAVDASNTLASTFLNLKRC